MLGCVVFSSFFFLLFLRVYWAVGFKTKTKRTRTTKKKKKTKKKSKSEVWRRTNTILAYCAFVSVCHKTHLPSAHTYTHADAWRSVHKIFNCFSLRYDVARNDILVNHESFIHHLVEYKKTFESILFHLVDLEDECLVVCAVRVYMGNLWTNRVLKNKIFCFELSSTGPYTNECWRDINVIEFVIWILKRINRPSIRWV